ncbi:tRNA(Met) cytidine acetyltransferase TmcA domain-containing protein, partial [Pantoea sp.]
MDLPEVSRAMQHAGVRRLCVISGESAWCLTQASAWRAALSGDWITISDDVSQFPAPHCAPSALRNLLGREFRHAIFDARSAFHAEAFAALAGTLCAGSWLLLLLPEWESWPQRVDRDSLRWADVAQAIATPHFARHLQAALLADTQVVLQRQHQPLRASPLPALPEWQCRAPQQQQAILQQLINMEPGVAVITAARGRGKSALAGMLAKLQGRCLVTAPAKVSTEVLAKFAGDAFRFMAPDAILACAEPPPFDWLIVDEAAAIPAPLLHQLAARFPRLLLTTTVQGYEGTGRGFMLKFCASLEKVRYFTLDEPLRWSRRDPLEAWLNQALLFEDASLPGAASGTPISRCEQQAWLSQPESLAAAYRLLASAHYRTSPLDLRRMMDAPGMHFWLAGVAPALQGALWLVEEGGLPAALAQAV